MALNRAEAAKAGSLQLHPFHLGDTAQLVLQDKVALPQPIRFLDHGNELFLEFQQHLVRHVCVLEPLIQLADLLLGRRKGAG